MSKLALAKKGKIKDPPRILIYGPEGIGKTTLAADAPDPIWLDIEGSSNQQDVFRYPFYPDDPIMGHVPKTYDEVLAAIEDLRTGQHSYKTLVLDTVDALEKLIHKFVVARDKVKPNKNESAPGIHSYGFHKGFDVALVEFTDLCSRLDQLRAQRGMQVILLAHMQIRKFEGPDLAPFDRYALRMNEKAAGALKDWCYVVGFACFEETTTDLAGENAKVKGVATGRRLLKLERAATHDAKCRYGMPKEIEMSLVKPWAPFAKALSEADSLTPEQLIAAILVECERVADDITTGKAKKRIEEANGDTAALHRILEKMRSK